MNEITRIINEICSIDGIPRELLSSKSRKREIVECRQKIMFFAWKYKRIVKLSLQGIGDLAGGKDHSTVLHSVKTVNNLYDTDREYRGKIDNIENRLISIFDEKEVNNYNLQVRLNMSQYRNGRYLYTLYGKIRVSKTRTLFIPVLSIDEVFRMINTTEVDSLNIHMDFRKHEIKHDFIAENGIIEAKI
jgi:hypothetical protein